MKNKIFVLLASMLALSFVSIAQQTIKYNGRDIFINGANVPWNSFGNDVGTHPSWGSGFSAFTFGKAFQNCKKYGINCVRLWIHCDGRATPEFDASGAVIGLDANFFSNFDAIMDSAARYNILVMPCLWSFDMTKANKGAGAFAGTHANLIRDTALTRTYIDKVLIPLVKRYDTNDHLFAWEVINEPEWSMKIKGGASTTDNVDAHEMQRFVGLIAAAVHRNSTKMVTVGSASVKYNSDVPGAIKNYWSDIELRNAANDSLAYLDFYQIHYYAWMYGGPDPFAVNKNILYWKLDKPTLIGELPGKDESYKLSQFYERTVKNGYCGLMFWSMMAGDGIASLKDFRNDTKRFRDANPDIVDYTNDTILSAQPPSVTISKDTIILSKDSLSKNNFGIYGRYKWTITNPNTWLKTSSDTGTGVSNITVIANEFNRDTTERIGYIYIKMDTFPLLKTIVIQNKSIIEKPTLANDGNHYLPVKVKPNPCKNVVNISVPETDLHSTFTIYNSLGIVVLTGMIPHSSTSISTSFLPKGAYIIKVISSKTIYSSILSIE